MCGIAGILRVHPPGEAPAVQSAIPDAWLELLDAAIAHRGPDGHGRFRDRAARPDGRVVDVAFVHRRLAVIDPAGGDQPLVTGTGSQVRATVFNGCIYNHRLVRAELASLGRVFVSDHCDTEVIPHAHAAWGDLAPSRLDGMFAYAVWSRAGADLVVARDRAGEKPLYEAWLGSVEAGGVYVFASTAAAIGRWLRRFGAVAGGGQLTCSRSGLLEWLRFGASVIPLLEQVSEVDARTVSHPVSADGRVPRGRSPDRVWYSDLPSRGSTPTAVTPAAVDRMVGDAVQSRLESDVPLGCFLSGGVDSSLVAWHARRALGTLRTFTVQMPDGRYDESRVAAVAARAIGSSHTTLPCDVRPSEQLPLLIGLLGLPFADSSLLPTYWVSEAARRHVTVALTGDAGDELFAGYNRHRVAGLLHSSHCVLGMIPPWLGVGGHPKSALAKLGRLGEASRHGYQELLAVFPPSLLAALVPGLTEAVAAIPHSYPTDAPRDDFEWYLPGDLLRKTDTAAMSVALETRAPFLARSLVDLGLSTPLDELHAGGRKGLLRSAARLHLPGSIVDRPKMGFAIPISDWLRSDYGNFRSLLVDSALAPGAFPPDLLGADLDTAFVRRLAEEHLSGVRDHGQRLYLLMVLAIWCREVQGW